MHTVVLQAHYGAETGPGEHLKPPTALPLVRFNAVKHGSLDAGEDSGVTAVLSFGPREQETLKKTSWVFFLFAFLY